MTKGRHACTARPHLRGEVGVGVLRGAGVELLDDGGAAVAERGVVDAAIGALADEGAVAEVVGDLLELVEGDGGHVDADGLGGAADPGRARSSRPASIACMRHAWIEMRRRWWPDDIDGDDALKLYRGRWHWVAEPPGWPAGRSCPPRRHRSKTFLICRFLSSSSSSSSSSPDWMAATVDARPG